MKKTKASSRFYKNILRGYWNNKWYDSSWELAMIVYFQENNMELTRNTRKFPYVVKGGRLKFYQPDFLVEDGSYIEVKGINDYKAKKKVASFPFPIKVLTYKDMKIYLDYMDKNHGKNWRDKFCKQETK